MNKRRTSNYKANSRQLGIKKPNMIYLIRNIGFGKGWCDPLMLTAVINEETIENRAESTLGEAGMATYPVDPVVIANCYGIKVSNALFNSARVSGVIRKRATDTQIFVNMDDAPARKRFTIAHELGHYFLHFNGDLQEVVDEEAHLFRASSAKLDPARAKQEREANRFAAALLMPTEWVKREWRRTRSALALAQVFKVSEEAMLQRLRELRLT